MSSRCTNLSFRVNDGQQPLAWIPTEGELTNKIAWRVQISLCGNVSFWLYTTFGQRRGRSLPEDQPLVFSAESRNPHVRLVEIGGDQQRVVGTLLKLNDNFLLG